MRSTTQQITHPERWGLHPKTNNNCLMNNMHYPTSAISLYKLMTLNYIAIRC